MTELKTPLYTQHVNLQAKMISFGSWIMPVQYTSILKEHEATRTAAAVFDTCHMGEFELRGPDALKTLQSLVPRNLAKSQDGRCYYTHLCNPEGGLIDDLIIYRFSKDHYWLVVNSETTPVDFKWIQEHLIGDCALRNLSEMTGKIDLQGPQSFAILKQLFSEQAAPLSKLRYYGFISFSWEGNEVLVSRTGYTGELGYEIYAPVDLTIRLWDQNIDLGAMPAGLGARDTLRLEMGYPLMGHELNSKTTPLEAGFSPLVDLNKDFLGKEALQSKGLSQHLIAFQISSGGIARAHTRVQDADGRPIGEVTSGTFSPSLAKAIGLAYVNSPLQEGTSIYLEMKNKIIEARVVRPPFYGPTSLKNETSL